MYHLAWDSSFLFCPQIENPDFDILLKYLEGLQGKGRQQTISEAEQLIGKDDDDSDDENNEDTKEDGKDKDEIKSK